MDARYPKRYQCAKVVVQLSPLNKRGASDMKITTIGVGLAKEVFQIHDVDEHGKTMLRKQLRRNKMTKFFANLEPCLISMEACGSSHHWAIKIGEFGHTVKLMSPQFVTPYVKTNNPRAKRGGKAAKRGISKEQIPVLVVRDRYGETADCIMNGTNAEQIGAALMPLLNKNVILCTDGVLAHFQIAKHEKFVHRQSILPPASKLPTISFIFKTSMFMITD
jgi:hypothetical protein